MQAIRRSMIKAAMSVVLASGLGLMTGCDEDSNTRGRSFRIEPGRATLSLESEILVLRAVGGESPYTWSVSDASLGTVSSHSHTVTYRRTALNGVNAVRVTDGQNWKAEMLIYQPAADPED